MMLSKFHKNKNQKGFTLIELLIVVAIIGILAAIAIPQFAAYRTRAFNSAAQSDLRTFRTSLESHFAENFEYPAVTVAYVANEINPDDDLDEPVGLSARVEAAYEGDTTWYNIGAYNQQGDKTYATSHNESNLYSIDGTAVDIDEGSGYDWASTGGWDTL